MRVGLREAVAWNSLVGHDDAGDGVDRAVVNAIGGIEGCRGLLWFTADLCCSGGRRADDREFVTPVVDDVGTDGGVVRGIPGADLAVYDGEGAPWRCWVACEHQFELWQ